MAEKPSIAEQQDQALDKANLKTSKAEAKRKECAKDVVDAEKTVETRFEEYMDKKWIFSEHGAQMAQDLKKLANIYDGIRQDKTAEIQILQQALQAPNFQVLPDRPDKIGFGKAMKIGAKASWYDYKLYYKGLGRIFMAPIPFINGVEFNKIAYGKLWAGIQNLQFRRKREMAVMNSEIRALRKELKLKNQQKTQAAERRNHDKKAEKRKKKKDMDAYASIMDSLKKGPMPHGYDVPPSNDTNKTGNEDDYGREDSPEQPYSKAS